jgi:hypothetical protein
MRLIPASYVEAYVKRSKDGRCGRHLRGGRSAEQRFAPVKIKEQLL